MWLFFREDVITAEDEVINARCAVYTLQPCVSDFLKLVQVPKKWCQKGEMSQKNSLAEYQRAVQTQQHTSS